MQNQYVDKRNSRGDSQDAVYQAIVDAGEDPFTKENLEKYHGKPILFENFSWFLIENKWPYDNTKHHFVFILQRYAEHYTELTEIERADLPLVISWIQRNYIAPGGAIIMRTGDTLYSGASVKHYHGHFIVPDVDGPDYGPSNRVIAVIGGNKEKPEDQ